MAVYPAVPEHCVRDQLDTHKQIAKSLLYTVSERYVETHPNWYRSLIKDNEGYGAFKRWAMEVQGQTQKDVPDTMIKHLNSRPGRFSSRISNAVCLPASALLLSSVCMNFKPHCA